MFGWIRKLTQRTAVEELIESSPASAHENSDSATAPQLAPSRGAVPARGTVPATGSAPTNSTEAFARPAEQRPAEPEMVEVYTPEPMPEPPTSEIPEPQTFDALEAPRNQDATPALATDGAANTAPAEQSASHAAPVVETPKADVAATAVEQGATEQGATEQTDALAEPAAVAAAAAAAQPAGDTAQDAPSAALERSPLDEEFDGLLAPPSPRPAMPLSAHPNFAGLGLAEWEPIAPRLLEPEAALTPEAQAELHKLFDDLFGPYGRYRLEWRTERRAGDDAMFAEIMTADLVRRVQNTIADVAELERPEPPKAIRAAFSDMEDADEDQPEVEDGEAFRRAS
ncbi:hypothetical protein [Gulosibacter molinativorax]|uniref:Uncharacterized protein n=1 Tax=Gulosibacter molinativorax TaxID=256821 RepID=A0ABT7CBP0_9MICO|nr:hypothetical protein [Gulosibacter molinativorax]MDJ1372618.1 hypothetical protein [Gulosibacter molinativorax]QUY62598.1 Hypotetical protein [Gulosibacter molinativorax]